MRASGNSNPLVCVENLIKTVRGEVPYERLKGLDRKIIDKPIVTGRTAFARDVDWNIRTYEPRVSPGDINIKALAAYAGNFQFDTNVMREG